MPSAFAFETLSPAASAVAFTAATRNPTNGNAPATVAVVSVVSGSIRVRWDGTAPTTTVGHRLTAGDWLTLTDQQAMRNFQCISDDGGTAEVAVTFER